jgi:hypothetical protein
MTLSECEERTETESMYDPKHKAFTITTHHTGSTSSRTNVPGGSPPLRSGTPRVDCGSPQLASPAKEEPDNNLNQFDFTSPIRERFRQARSSFLPSYHSQSPSGAKPFSFGHRPTSSIYSRATNGEPSATKKKFWQRQRAEQDEEAQRMPEISYPLNVNPQFAHLVKPNLAHHPSQRRPEADYDKI